jgi:hypothetical protein
VKENELRGNLIEVVIKIRDDRKLVSHIKKGMKKIKILPGKVQSFFNNPHLLWEIDIEAIYFFTENVYLATEDPNIKPTKYFTNREIKEIKTSFSGDNTNRIVFPYTFNNVLKGTEDDYILYIKASEIKILFEYGLLQYNSETQREMRQSKGKDSDEIIETPKIIEKSINEMEALLNRGEMISTIITLNARLGSTDDESGEELLYIEDAMTLTVTKGPLLDVLDRFHRINAIVRALFLLKSIKNFL